MIFAPFEFMVPDLFWFDFTEQEYSQKALIFLTWAQ